MNWADKRYAVGRGIAAIRAKTNGEDTYFIYCCIRESLQRLLSLTSGSVFPNLSTGDINGFEIPWPETPVRRSIVHILRTLDDKIELNRRMNRTLEKMAAAIFKSWFIDFDPVVWNAVKADKPVPEGFAETAARYKADLSAAASAKAEGQDTNLPKEIADLFPDSFEDSEIGPIPKGWELRSLDQIAHYLNGLACQKFPPVKGEKSLPVIKIRELRQGITTNTDRATANVPTEYIVEDGDILFSWSASLLVTIWCNGRGVLNQHVFKVTSTEFPKWFIYHWTKYHLHEFQLIAGDKATTMGHIKRQHLADAKVVVPDHELIEKGSEILGNMLKRQINALKQAHLLSLLRDTLLPKLLNGEIEVDAAKGMAQEIAG